MNNSVIYVTEEGLEKIKAELEILKNERRQEISERLELAISHGDLSENADYDYAKQEQAFVEGRIKDLEDSLRRAKIIEPDGRVDRVRVGNTVTVMEVDFEDEPESYHIVGVHEADPGSGRISNESPVGRALLGARVGDTVVAQVPAGEVRMIIKQIT
ncbi:MAG TPA: transcription elongation factor GreA [Patescibacteria group bacterium]|nr:transcription elongation factor GreA [Patescibacteria group bacterium]